MRGLLFFFLFSILSTLAVAQQLDTLALFDFRSVATKIQIAPDGGLVVLGNEGAATSDAYYHREGFLKKYDQEGELLWEQNYLFESSEFSSMTVDPFGNIYIAFSDNSFEMRKYDPNGELLWEKKVSVNATGNFRITPDVLHADEDHLYMGAHYFGKGFFELDTLDKEEKGPLCIIQYDLDGAAQWIKYLGATNGDFTGIDGDEDSNVYFSTTTFNYIELDTFKYFGPGQTGAVGKITVDSKTEWLQPFAGVSNGHVCSSIALDKFSNVYAVGRLTTGTPLVKYNKEGEVLWVSSMIEGGAALLGVRWNDVYVNEFGEIYTAGLFTGTVNFGVDILNGTDIYEGDFVFAKYNNEGKMLWVKSIPGERRDEIFSITGFQNKIFMAGFSHGVLGSQSIPFENYFTVLKYEEPFDLSFYRQKISLFPNPNNGQFCVYLNSGFRDDVQVTVYDMLGHSLYEKHYEKLFGLRPFIAISLPGSIVPGHYIFNIKSGDNEKSLIFATY